MAVVTTQPQGNGYSFVLPDQMKVSEAMMANCPPGLEYLTQIDQILIKQKVELCEVLTGFETKNKYQIFNSMGQQMFYAEEVSSCMMRVCCGEMRGFEIFITDNNGQEVMRISREFKCCAGCCWCANGDHCALEVRVEAPVGNVIGYVRQMQYCWAPVLGIFNADHDQIATARGPCCVCNCPCCGDVEFPVLTLTDNKADEQDLAMFSKQWSGMVLEMFTDSDHFNISFPLEMDPKIKGTLFGLMLLVDFMYFEKKN